MRLNEHVAAVKTDPNKATQIIDILVSDQLMQKSSGEGDKEELTVQEPPIRFLEDPSS